MTGLIATVVQAIVSRLEAGVDPAELSSTWDEAKAFGDEVLAKKIEEVPS